MKSSAFSLVLTADQVNSREQPDRVPAALSALEGLDTLLPFDRTAGDEIQALFASPFAATQAIAGLTRLGGWRVGLGIGAIDNPLPNSTRAARGPAYLAAREALQVARRQPTGLALRFRRSVVDDRYGEDDDRVRDAETALWLWRGLLSKRSQEGWELMDLLDAGQSKSAAARSLGVSASAVSQRLAVAGRQEGDRGAILCSNLLARLLTDAEVG